MITMATIRRASNLAHNHSLAALHNLSAAGPTKK